MCHLDAYPVATWSDEVVEAILYLVARDHEIEHLAEEIRLCHPETLLPLASEATARGEQDARWQLADALGHLGPMNNEAERLLLIFADDEAEYVRRRALSSLSRIGSPAVERLALQAWERPDECQGYQRMVVLDCLARIGSPHLGRLLDEAERDERPYLPARAERIRRGEVDPP